MSERITLSKKVIIINQMIAAGHRAQRRNGLTSQRCGFYTLSAEERIMWLGIAEWHLSKLTGGPAK